MGFVDKIKEAVAGHEDPPAAHPVGQSAERHGEDDAVIEINPRVTTSYVGLRQAVDQNLAQLLLKAVHGEPIEVTVRNPNIEFAADGATWVNRR